MNRMLAVLSILLPVTVLPVTALCSPEEDRILFQDFFKRRFPDIPYEDFGNGVNAIDPHSRAEWEETEELPPYLFAIERGETLWNRPFHNGKGYRDCFPDGPAISHSYPRWDPAQGLVVTLALAVNRCRKANGEVPLPYKQGPLMDLLAFMAYRSRGNITRVEIPQGEPRALEAYQEGKRFYFARRGQYNFSCAHCHALNAGKRLRGELLSPALGHTTGWPTYRLKWGEVGSLHRRFSRCLEQMRAKPFPVQGREYRNLEYFFTYMNNGLPQNGPSFRK